MDVFDNLDQLDQNLEDGVVVGPRKLIEELLESLLVSLGDVVSKVTLSSLLDNWWDTIFVGLNPLSVVDLLESLDLTL